MDLQLNGKVALITGGSKGIGKVIARTLAEEGVSIAICARGKENLLITAEELIRNTGGQILPIQADMTNTEDVNHMVNQVIEKYGKIDILINNAAMVGGQVAANLAEAREEDLIDDLDTKVIGYFRTIKAVVPYMKKEKWGRIINIGGLSARQSTFFGMRNSAIVHMTKTLSDQLGSEGITVNVIHPGSTETESVLERQEKRAAEQKISLKEFQEINASKVAIKRIIRPEELADVVCFLASPKAECITGESIAAGGGSLGAVFV
jgi:NAD(P)-dependent dehydrogenase (short-subunit alcohol dehydrogenase family)|tara:strand:+ start:334 stop:1125 length:792 start_codon:yes stop_codon:yes gene_type:complete